MRTEEQFCERYSLYDTAIKQPGATKQGREVSRSGVRRSSRPTMYPVRRRRGGGRSLQQRRHIPPEASPAWRLGRSAELDLLLLCARWPQRDEDRQLIRALSEFPWIGSTFCCSRSTTAWCP